MSERMSREAVRERDERDARFFAWDVPGDAHIVALVHEADEAERSATVADAIATSVARRREHTLLLCAAAGPSPLDELLGGAGSPGLPAALEGRARLTDIAVQRVDRPFVYLPAGRDPVAMGALLDDDLLASFVERVRERGGTLFIVLSERTLLADGLVTLLDGYVALGEVDLPSELEPLRQFGRVRFEDPAREARSGVRSRPAPPIALPELPDVPGDDPELEADRDAETAGAARDGRTDPGSPFALDEGVRVADGEDGGASATSEEAGAGAADAVEEGGDGRPPVAPWTHADDAGSASAGSDGPEADESPGDATPVALWRRHRNPPGFPAGRVAFGAAVIVAVAGVWWLIARAAEPATQGGAAQAEASPAVPPAEASPPPVFDAAAAARAFEEAPALGYSVLIASYADRADAEERLAALRARSEGFYFLAPTPVRGIVYHRVFAGALAGRDEGRALMDALVEARLKDAASEWDVRPAGLAFDLGLFAERGQADARVRVLAERAISAYALPADDAPDAPWRVYGGAFERERAAGPMAELLEETGEPANLVERRGNVPTPPSNE